ncbi:MAG: hypothetical protein QOF58_5307 [Pseudonocardiales bacterium]|nr:hypothetical protein [Pseudonocardiales bacterium]
MPEQPSISISVSIAPRIANGLHALVQKTLSDAAPQVKPKDDRRAGDKIVNRSDGPVHGTLVQIGKVHGDVNDYRGR